MFLFKNCVTRRNVETKFDTDYNPNIKCKYLINIIIIFRWKIIGKNILNKLKY